MTNLSNILIPGAVLKPVRLNYENVRERIEETKSRQEEVLKRKEVDYEMLSRTYITI